MKKNCIDNDEKKHDESVDCALCKYFLQQPIDGFCVKHDTPTTHTSTCKEFTYFDDLPKKVIGYAVLLTEPLSKDGLNDNVFAFVGIWNDEKIARDIMEKNKNKQGMRLVKMIEIEQ